MSKSILPSSFRDPDGFLFKHSGIIYRQVNNSYKDHYDQLMSSGLYDSLTEKGWLIPHKEIDSPSNTNKNDKDLYKTLYPEQISYVSYPYEWCFSQLKDAAILTLNIQQEALKYGMSLKDASAYNIQFHKGKIVFIDTLSFESYQEGNPWVAYRQFCQHFLTPLALITECDYRLIHLLRAYIDGIPLDLASQLLPIKSWFKYSLLAHIHLHSKTQKQFEDSGRKNNSAKEVSVSKLRLVGIISSLHSAVNSLSWKHADTEWGNYYSDTNYADDSMDKKGQLVSKLLDLCEKSDGSIAADFGANTGKFSRIAINRGYYVLSYDIDEVAVDKNYQKMVRESEKMIYPLVLNITNPSPGLGWASTERTSFIARKKVHVGMTLALIHHIAISNNIPLPLIAELFSRICTYLIIEFVPKSDSQVKRLLSTREDVFPNYHHDGFESAFTNHFHIIEKIGIEDTERTLYLMKIKHESTPN